MTLHGVAVARPSAWTWCGRRGLADERLTVRGGEVTCKVCLRRARWLHAECVKWVPHPARPPFEAWIQGLDDRCASTGH